MKLFLLKTETFLICELFSREKSLGIELASDLVMNFLPHALDDVVDDSDVFVEICPEALELFYFGLGMRQKLSLHLILLAHQDLRELLESLLAGARFFITNHFCGIEIIVIVFSRKFITRIGEKVLKLEIN